MPDTTATSSSTPVSPIGTPPATCLPPGMFRVGGRLYAVCDGCRSVVRLNKPVLGSLHVCSGEVGS